MRNRYLIVIGILLFTAVAVRLLSYDTFNNPEKGLKAIANIPLSFGQWQGKDITMDELVYDILETRSIIHRTYSAPTGENVFLSIVYYTETKVDFHAPESCLAGQGTQIAKEDKTISFNNAGQPIKLDLNQLVRQEEKSNTLSYYFYKAGKFLGRDYIRLRLNLMLNKFASEEKSGSLIRVSTPISTSPDGGEKAAATLRKFVEELYPYLLRL